MSRKESKKKLISRHSEFAHWGRTLKEAVDKFGSDVNAKGSSKVFYHGIDSQMLFESTIAQFHGPLSTSSTYEVSLVFANRHGRGLIITLQNMEDCQARYFDCAWLRYS